MWELFTLLSFSTLEHAQERITLAALTSEGKYEDGLDDLVSFDVSRAHCYDPNEEARLRSIINVSSEVVFNSRIRKLAEACRSAQQRWGYIDLGMGLVDIKGLLPNSRRSNTEQSIDLDALQDRIAALEDEFSRSRMTEFDGLLDAKNGDVGGVVEKCVVADSIDEKLATLKRLSDKGYISEEEIRVAKTRVLLSFGL